ncbi:MAG TPA: MBL fold metallo-hydrolase [Candidatus Binatia bacterium]|nr:MBL fold metallo-hydrolase [Candidatus Binatia bacterium]
MSANVSEIAPDVFRISAFHPAYGIQFNQFVIRDDEPFLMHTGFRQTFDQTLEAVARVIDPASLRWIGFSHFEPDECGALNRWLAVAPGAQAVTSFVGKVVMLDDFADREARALEDDEVLPIGRRRLRFLATPHLPHGWDAGLFFEEVDRTLLCSDLFFQPGDPEPRIESDVVGPARDAIVAGMSSPLRGDVPYTASTDATMRRIAALEPRTLAIMHGSSFAGDGGRAVRDLAAVLAETIGPGPAR